MTVRLAFSVAAHLEPEILIIDEVLAVGDAEFQRKCLGKMGEMARGGRTVLFVSHNMGAIKRLCSSALLLEDGQVEYVGEPGAVVDRYLSRSLTTQAAAEDWSGGIDMTAEQHPSTVFQIRRVRLVGHLGQLAVEFDNRYPISVEMEVELREARRDAYVGVVLYSVDDTNLFSSRSHDLGDEENLQRPGRYAVRVDLPGNVFNSGLYRLGVFASLETGGVDRYEFSFQLTNGQPFGTTVGGHRVGPLLLPLKWEIGRETKPR
jgi:lipopolysaccharide transport system ATP-binding protein